MEITSKTKQQIAEDIMMFRNSGKLDEALQICSEAAKLYPIDYFYPKIAGDLYFQKGDFEAASRQYYEFLRRIPPVENLFTEFASRYFRLKRVWSQKKTADYALFLRAQFKQSNIKPLVAQYTEKLIKSDLPKEVAISEQGNVFVQLLQDDKNFVKLAQQEKTLESRNPVELESILDQHVLNRKRTPKTYQIDTYCISLYEKNDKFEGALKVASELLALKVDPVVVRSVFRICRKTAKYEVVDNLLARYPEILKNNDFNILYELVYYFEYQNNSDQLQSILQRMEKNGADSLPIQTTARNFYLRFGLLDDANRVGENIKGLAPKRGGFSEMLETESDVGSKIKELYSEVEHKTRLAAISDLTTGISHELGQPITNIRYTVQFYTRMFERRLEKEDVMKVFSSILEETERMGALVKRLAPLTSSKSVDETFDIVDRIRKRVNAENARLLKEKISVQIQANRVIVLFADPVKIDQVIGNLLLNAIDAIRERGWKAKREIAISVDEIEEDVTVLFSDTGIGVPIKNRGKIFDPFFTTKQPGKGEGLGLFIVWNIIKMYGGKIGIDPNYTQGTRFTLTLPKNIKQERIG